MSEQLKVLFKTKGGHKEGMGDVTSSLSLAGEFTRQGYDVCFLINDNQNVVNLLKQTDFKYIIVDSLQDIENYLSMDKANIVILNQLNTSYDEAVLFKKYSKLLVTIEDTGNAAMLADLRFNVLYPIDNAITDFKYIPLATTFQKKHRNTKETKERVANILVTQGGSDTYGFTPKIISALYMIPAGITINVVLGANFSHQKELDDVLRNAPREFDIVKGVNDLSDLMLQADLAISAGGNTLFELACLGVPTVVVCGEPFEVETADRLQKEGFGINLGFGRDVEEKMIYNVVSCLIYDMNTRLAMSKKGKELVDGQGVKRVVESIIEKINIWETL